VLNYDTFFLIIMYYIYIVSSSHMIFCNIGVYSDFS
jgi:hypothetical protein